jgi:hypothetical protein
MANSSNTPPTFAAADVAAASAEIHRGVVSILRGLIQKNPDQVLRMMIKSAKQRLIAEGNQQAADFLDVLFAQDFPPKP